MAYTNDDAKKNFRFPSNFEKIKFSQNEGFSMEDAIVITNAQSSFDGVGAEYQYITQRFGVKSVDWTLKMQSLLEENGKAYDQMQLILLKEAREICIYFDITEFFSTESF